MKSLTFFSGLVLFALLAGCAGTGRSTGRPASPRNRAAPEGARPAESSRTGPSRAPPLLPPTTFLFRSRQEDLAARERDLAEKVEQKPDDPSAWNAWAVVAADRGDYPSCLSRAERALALSPDFRDAVLNRGLALFALRRYAEAIRCFDRVLELSPDPRLFTDYRLAKLDYERKRRKGKIRVPFEEAMHRGLLPVDRDGMFAKWYRRFARIAARGPGFARSYRLETRHYVVVTDASEGLARLVGEQLELELDSYEGLFPPGRTISIAPKFEVIVFRRRSEYLSYLSQIMNDRVAAHMSGGSYHAALKELLLSWTGDLSDSLLVLGHEGFHQYLDRVAGGGPPWFGEGAADYFGASRLEGGRLVPGAAHPLRMGVLRKILPGLDLDELEWVLKANQSQFMGAGIEDFKARSARVGRDYALSWAFVDFLAQTDLRPLLVRYYDVLRRGATAATAYRVVLRPVLDQRLLDRFKAHVRGLLAADATVH